MKTNYPVEPHPQWQHDTPIVGVKGQEVSIQALSLESLADVLDGALAHLPKTCRVYFGTSEKLDCATARLAGI